MRKLQALLLCVLLLSAACKKEDPEASLPPISQEGSNTGGFLIDGAAYPATGWTSGFLNMAGSIKALEGGYDMPWGGFPAKPDYSLTLNSEQGKKRVSVTLFLRHPQAGESAFNRDTGLPPQARDSTIFDHATVYFEDGDGEIYSTSSLHTGRVLMTVNSPSRYLSAGTFEFTAASNLDPRKTVRLSAGRFDRRQ